MLLMRKQWKEQIPPLKIILENSKLEKKIQKLKDKICKKNNQIL